MFVFRFVLLIGLVNIVLSEETDDDIRVSVHRPKQLPVYAYNHPPIFELNDDIFVEKVKNVREIKSSDFTTLKPLDDISNDADSEDKQANTQALGKDSQIPVRVVYDNNSNENNPSSNSNGSKEKRRNKRKRNKQLIKNEPSLISVSTTKQQAFTTTSTTPKPIPVNPTTQAYGDVTLFPKRPAEDSKRIKFLKQPRVRPPVVKILDAQNFVYAHTGNFHYSYDSADGTKVSSRGELRSVNEGTGEAVVGSVSYTDDDGNDFSLSYTADENGYQPVGAHLPTPPPIPPAIARALRYLATKTPDPVTDLPLKKTF